MAESPDEKRSGSKQSTDAGDEARADKSIQAFRDALEKSVTLSRDRLQEVVDDAVARGRITRDDANELVSRLVARSRQQTESMLRDLERLLGQARDRLR
jgi:polyhydroxyalkanoate synthesis regulator phasin